MQKTFVTILTVLGFTALLFAGERPQVNIQKNNSVIKINHIAKPAGATLFSESFEGEFPPSGWLRVSNGSSPNEWSQTDSKAHTGTYSAYVAYSLPWQTMDEWLITPAIDLSGLNNAILEFYEDEHYWDDSGVEHDIKVSTTSQSDLNSFTDLLVMTPNNHTIEGFNGDPVTLYLSDYAGESTVYIAFRYTGSYADYWYIDDVTVSASDDHDVKAVSVDMNSHYDVSSTVQPQGTVVNAGQNTETFDVQFGYLEWDGSEVVLDTKTVSNLAPGASTQVTFADYTFTDAYEYYFFIRTMLSSDMNTANDRATLGVNSFQDLKTHVLMEKATGVECQYCPGAAWAADELFKNHPDSVSVIEYHWYTEDDPFLNDDSKGRIRYYGITGYPTAVFDGINYRVGGRSCSDQDLWDDILTDYESMYQDGLKEPTGFSLSLKFFEEISPSDTTITAVSTTTYLAPSYVTDYKLRYALIESHIPYQWQDCMDSVQFVERKMFPDYNGKDFYSGSTTPTTGMTYSDTVVFSFPSGVVKENSDLVVFLQNDVTQEVMATARVSMNNPTSAIQEQHSLQPNRYVLYPNHPNPFNPTTQIQYYLPHRSNVTLEVYNAIGQKIQTLVNEKQAKGFHHVTFNGSYLSSGVYYYTLKAEGFSQTNKMLLIK